MSVQALVEAPRSRSAVVRVERALRLGFNVLLTGRHRRLDVAELRRFPGARHLSASDAGSVGELLAMIGHTLGAGDLDPTRFDVYDQVGLLAKHLHKGRPQAACPTLILDEPPSDLAIALFGRLRDELWEVGVTWLVVVDPETARMLDRPPSNAFFESVEAGGQV